MQDTNTIYKILLTIFCGSSQTWYYNLESRFILNFKDLYAKLKTHFNINIPTIKSSTKLFTITQQEDEVTIIYLKRFKKKMLKLEGLLKFMVIKALIKKKQLGPGSSHMERAICSPEKIFLKIK